MANDGVATTSLLDVLQATQDEYYVDVDNMPEFNLTLSDSHVVGDWMSKAKRVSHGGDLAEARVSMERGSSYQQTQPFAKLPANVTGDYQTVSTRWTYGNHRIMFEDRENLLNQGTQKIIDVYKSRRAEETIGTVETMETLGFNAPENSSDVLNPKGLQYWLNTADRGTAAGTKGFIGKTAYFGDGTSTQEIGGISSASYSNWRNWAHVYGASQSIDNGWINTVLKPAFIRTKFKTPKMVSKVPGQDNYTQFKIYCGVDEYEALDTLQENRAGESKNDLSALGENTLRYKGIEICRADPLDGLAHSPFIGVNNRHFQGMSRSGEWFRESRPMVAGTDQHRTYVIHTDFQYNFLCKNKRHAGFVLSREQSA